MKSKGARLVIVTGGSRGIGAAVARLAGTQGYTVAVNFLQNQRAARGVVEQIVSSGGSGIAIRGDVAREADIIHLFEEAEAAFGPVYGLVNNAGITGGSTMRPQKGPSTALRSGLRGKWLRKESESMRWLLA